MNQDNWNALTQRLAERDQTQQQIEHLQSTLAQQQAEIGQLSAALQQELAQLQPAPTPTLEPEPEPNA